MTAKPSKTTPDTPGIVRTLRALAESASVTARTAGDWKTRPGFPIRADGFFSVWNVAVWFATVGPGAGKNAAAIDPEMAGKDTDSVWLEEYRKFRAGLAEMDLLERRGQLIPREFVREVFGLVASRLRQLGERFNTGTADPAAMLDDAIDDIDRLGASWIAEHLKPGCQP